MIGEIVAILLFCSVPAGAVVHIGLGGLDHIGDRIHHYRVVRQARRATRAIKRRIPTARPEYPARHRLTPRTPVHYRVSTLLGPEPQDPCRVAQARCTTRPLSPRLTARVCLASFRPFAPDEGVAAPPPIVAATPVTNQRSQSGQTAARRPEVYVRSTIWAAAAEIANSAAAQAPVLVHAARVQAVVAHPGVAATALSTSTTQVPPMACVAQPGRGDADRHPGGRADEVGARRPYGEGEQTPAPTNLVTAALIGGARVAVPGLTGPGTATASTPHSWEAA